MKLKLIGCEILYREICAVVARSRNCVDIMFMPKGLHDMPTADMLAWIQAQVDDVPADRYEAVVLAYALCNNGLAGVTARELPLILPRAHDCITLFLGSKERYRDYFFNHPGVYFLTSGWMERNSLSEEIREMSIMHQTGMTLQYQELVDKYGEDNAQYLMETLGDTTRHYNKFTFIDMGIEPEYMEQQARECANDKGWDFEKVEGDMTLIQQLVDGPWDEAHFLTVPPGRRIKASYNDRVVDAE